MIISADAIVSFGHMMTQHLWRQFHGHLSGWDLLIGIAQTVFDAVVTKKHPLVLVGVDLVQIKVGLVA